MAARPRIGLCGHGRFGAALCGLAEESGLTVAAYDPGAEIPHARKAASLAELARRSDVILVSVPLERFSTTLDELWPSLREKHLLLDVGSVKLEPLRAMRESLGDELAWCATHPLFGPTSLARGERPLRVVICEGSNGASERAQATWAALGCECIQQSAEAHDRAMARSHALAFFLAKGLLEIEAGEGAPFTPPSFEAIAKTITAVRSDAGHLFRSIQNQNPFSAEERTRLMQALARIHEELALPGQAEGAPECAIPALQGARETEAHPEDLLEELDNELLQLLSRRALLRTRLAPSQAESSRARLLQAAEELKLEPQAREALDRLLRED